MTRPGPGDGVPEQIAEAIRERSDVVPVAGVVLGSGLGETIRVAKELAGNDEGLTIAYTDLPGFPPPSVPGHAGKLWLGTVGDRPLAIFQGRNHFYEGHGMPMAAITSRVASELGAGTMMLTTAVGALDPALTPGTVVVIRDHINWMGTNTLAGWRMPDGSPAFIDVADVYDPDLSDAALEAARGADGVPATEGVYAAVAGPSYETPAESAFLRQAGGTVVGMSMIPEAVAAHALGMRVVGLSFVTNAAGAATSHEEVLEASTSAASAIGRVLAHLIERF
jgi:purine-nucleoside phosphorylase